MKKTTLLLSGAAFLLLTSCGGGEPEEEPIDPEIQAIMDEMEAAENMDKTPFEVTWEQMESGEVKPGQVVIFEAYISPLNDTRTSYGNSSTSFSAVERRNKDSGKYVLVSIPVGKGKNQMEKLPDEYYHSDLKVHTNNDSVASVGERVRITGELDRGISDRAMSIDLIEIEKLGGFDDSVIEDAVELTEEYVKSKEDELEKGIYGYLDVDLTFRFTFAIGQQNYSLGFEANNNSEITSGLFQIGYWPGTMTTDDNGNIYLYTMDGDFAQKGEKVRLYGSLSKSYSSTSFRVEEVVKL